MRRVSSIVVAGAFVFLAAAVSASDGWVQFEDESSARLVAAPGVASVDLKEKDYAWGDFDQDGDIDLVVARRMPWDSALGAPNVLLMNEGIADGHETNGVLVDRTAQYASASDIEGDQGFLTPTNDRDVVLHDLDNDGWLDMVTAPTITDNQAKHLSHPRVYMNLGEIGGVWQGFRYEDARIPEMHPFAGPRFCAVAAGGAGGNRPSRDAVDAYAVFAASFKGKKAGVAF